MPLSFAQRKVLRPANLAGFIVLLLTTVSLGCFEAVAQPSTLAMTCSQAAALVRSKGALVLSTSATTYDRYVSEIRYCAAGEQLQPEWVATRDVAKCFIGYTCFTPDRSDWLR